MRTRPFASSVVLSTTLVAPSAPAAVDLQLAPPAAPVRVGDVFQVELVGRATGPSAEQIAAADVIFAWDASVLRLTDATAWPGAPWILEGFPGVPLNAGVVHPFLDIPANDGDALFQALAAPGLSLTFPVAASTPFVQFEFEALSASPSTEIRLLAEASGFTTRVLTVGNINRTGALSDTGGFVVLHPLGDMNCDGAITVGDIAPFVLALTDPAGYVANFPDCAIENGDVSGDGQVTVSDIDSFVALLVGG